MLRDVSSDLIVLTTKPFAGYRDFDACVTANSNKTDPEGYCASIMRRVERARIYVKDPSKAPPGVPLNTGPRGGMWFDSSAVPKRTGYKPTKSPKQPKGKAPKKPKEEKLPKHVVGDPYGGPDDANLPANVKRENPDIRADWVKRFNETLDAGGSEADALANARGAIPDRSGKEPIPKKPPAPPRRKVGDSFQGGDDPQLPQRIRQESPQVREAWVKTFNQTLAKNGSEADAIHAANQNLPQRTTPKPPTVRQPKPPRTQAPAVRKDISMNPEPTASRAMICLYVDPAIAEMLAVMPTIEAAQAGIEIEESDDLHCTLAYYPLVQVEERDALIQRAAQIASNFSAPRMDIEGIGQFFPGDDDPIPYVLLLNPETLTGMHDSLCYYGGSPQPARNHGYIPHITLAYVPAGVQLQFSPPSIPELPFSAVSVVFDTQERHDFAFSYAGGPEVAYRNLREKVDGSEDATHPSQSPPTVEVSQQQRSEDTNTNGTALETKSDASGPADQDGLPERTQPDGVAEIDKAGKRMRSSWREKLSEIVDHLRGMMSWADYEDMEATDAEKAIQDGNSFVVFKDAITGKDRWLSFSSNGFQDRETEIVSTAALEAVVARADEGLVSRGKLRLFHIPVTDIGDCDFQAVEGRFLIESGTFNDTELARKAIEYFQSTDEKLGTSIGFLHPKTEFDGKVYREVTAIIERSVCPHLFVANPWTSFALLDKGEPMDVTKSAFLERVAGADLAAGIIKRADEATKSLEGMVAFKEDTELTTALETVKSKLEGAPQETLDAYANLLTSIVTVTGPAEGATKSTEEETPTSDVTPPAFDQEALLAKISDIVNPVAVSAAETAATVATLSDSVKTLNEKVKSIEDESLAEKARRENEPRGASMFRASAADSNTIAAAKAKELLGVNEPQVSPVSAYVDDLLKGRIQPDA